MGLLRAFKRETIARTFSALLIASILTFAYLKTPAPGYQTLERTTFVAGIRG